MQEAESKAEVFAEKVLLIKELLPDAFIGM